MASVYNSDDTFNVIEDHLRQTLEADTKLATGGDLAIVTWEQEHRDDISTYEEHLLPAISIEVGVQALTDIALGDLVDYSYLAHLLLITKGGQTQALLRAESKYYAARVVRVLQQQHYPSKQLTDLPSDLDGGEAGAVQVIVTSAGVNVGTSERNPNVLRGLAEIFAVVTVGIQIPED
jgi:hypothetical protein